MFVGKGQLQNPGADFTGHRGTSMQRGSGARWGSDSCDIPPQEYQIPEIQQDT